MAIESLGGGLGVDNSLKPVGPVTPGVPGAVAATGLVNAIQNGMQENETPSGAIAPVPGSALNTSSGQREGTLTRFGQEGTGAVKSSKEGTLTKY